MYKNNTLELCNMCIASVLQMFYTNKKKRGDIMPASKAHIRATIKYETKSYDKLCIRIRKDADITREDIQAAADLEGESVNAYVMEAVRRRIESDAEEKDR